MEEFLSFVTIDKWEIIFTWGNLLILYFLMKKFLFGPVREMIDQREQEVRSVYERADSSFDEAMELKKAYEEKMFVAKNTCEEMIKNAERTARLREEAILNDAKLEAKKMALRAEEKIALEQKNAVNDVKNEISKMVVGIASKVIEKDLDTDAHMEMIEKFISEMDDVS